jgi:hypothetical protein
LTATTTLHWAQQPTVLAAAERAAVRQECQISYDGDGKVVIGPETLVRYRRIFSKGPTTWALCRNAEEIAISDSLVVIQQMRYSQVEDPLDVLEKAYRIRLEAFGGEPSDVNFLLGIVDIHLRQMRLNLMRVRQG